ncbi:Peptidase inhibitor I78 family protein [Novosphingobium sp. CF614]|uniref:I78 family peptidase inhibitor n=1 Tax=Novosphingobium sp. CF614 TaxID=1884364 RepID=UPI0008F222BB|nr:I78 family peptidase inhibitor [Novosphingobium sp. CF614]SFG41957.1 Peptidase inhibitor I78 family protein [Novosphingobium sp. CF614]
MSARRTATWAGLLAGSLLATAGCAAGTSEPQATPPPPASQGCGAEQLSAYIGQPASDEVLALIRQWHGDKPIRVLKPGSAMTMDYRPERLNIYLDDAGTIKEFKCN